MPKIDTQRQEIFEFYQSFDSPILNIGVQFDCENFLPELKEKNVSPFQFIVFNICKTVMEVENFKYRFDGEKIYKIERLVPSYTVLRDSGNFNFCTFEFDSDFPAFLKQSLVVKEKAEKAEGFIHDDPNHRDYIFLTCLPWFNFTSIQHPVGRFKDSSIPAIAFGKFEVKEDRLVFPLFVQAHHGLVDGVHIHQFFSTLKENLKSSLGKLA